MTDQPTSSAAEPEKTAPPAMLASKLDTTEGSIIHYVFERLPSLGLGDKFRLVKLYGASLLIGFIPLFIAAALSGPSLFDPAGSIRLPFFQDWNVMFMFLVSFPCLIILAATDQETLAKALKVVLSDGTIQIPEDAQITLANGWSDSFRGYNLWAQWVGAVIGAGVASSNYVAYVSEAAGLWITDNGKILPAAYVYFYAIWLFYTVATIYVIRSLSIALLLRDVVKSAESLHMLPFHPDKAGGLRPVGHLGLRNQYALSLFGVNVAVLLLVTQRLAQTEFLIGLTIAAIAAYLVVGPFVFVAALLPFRSAMQDNKARLMKTVAQRMRFELDRLHAKLTKDDPITKDDEELVDRLRKISTVIDELPVWPFDAVTLRKFLTAYFIPIASAAYPVAQGILGGLPLFQRLFGHP